MCSNGSRARRSAPTAFSFFHTVFGFPAARWADRGDRRVIVTLSAVLWGGMTAMCGFVTSGIQLGLARIGVGIGEATTPVLHSILSDESNRHNRARAMSILTMGAPLAALFCYPAIGWIEANHGWRAAFIAAGVPGLILAAVVWFTFRDRVREAQRQKAAGRADTPPLGETLRTILTQRTFMLNATGYVISQVGIMGFTVWAPTYLRRVHELTAASAGASFGVSTGVLGLAGALIGGIVLERSARHGDRWKSLWPAMATVMVAPFILLATFVQSVGITLFAMGAVAFCVAFKFGPVIAIAVSVVKPRMRAMASSIQGFAASILAIGGGPLLVGTVSDGLAPTMGNDGLRYALMLCAAFALVGAMLMAAASTTIERDLALAEADEA